MKKYSTILISFMLISIIGCQKEEETIIQDDTQTFTSSSTLSGLLLRTSQFPTAFDNVLDNSSCFSVQLPVTVIVNNQQILVSNQSDYQLVQNAINQFSNDDDIVNFVYPITIVYQNFQTQVLQNSNDLDDVLDECDEDDGFDEIDCININYPIVINIYDSNNQIANTITITSNSMLFNFLSNTNSSTLLAVVFPISVTNSNGQNVVINNNSELENFIEDSISDCDDDSNGGSNNTTLTEIFTSGTWYISYFFDDVDETNYFNGYNFTFNSNGTSLAVKNSNNINGTWNIYNDSGTEKIVLSFDGSLLDEIEDDWRIIEYTPTLVKLKHVSGGNGGTDYLTFTKN
ncbi:hypothetical protein [Flavobacterium capsici]|uniref:Lipocalin-like domain-containing protein n=1 Tax=Flavobacterium capsici TaxID=3075618 RepID=A0AA96F580_9FLAO|nr:MULTISPECIES: hypothetical protein [unclassified Flavobacterium]WNM18962.1 hypothetical protein RN608_13225 [Flavobacterium sp. PMR2A8]WNM23012.1 hypothetical protein RN605_06525 [Flavobacterium sp. PMTSA4]